MLPDLSALVQQCAPNVGPTTIMAIIRTESSGNPWAINDNTARLVRQPATKEEAVATAKDLIGQGHSVDMGLGQVNSKNLAALGLSVEQVFEPCTNVAASAAILTAGYQRAVKQHGEGQPALLAALSAYNTGSLTLGFGNGYVQKVLANAGQPVAISIPSLTTGTVFKGRHGAVRIEAGGVTPYNAPLEASFGRPQTASAYQVKNPRSAPLEAPGFGSLASR